MRPAFLIALSALLLASTPGVEAASDLPRLAAAYQKAVRGLVAKDRAAQVKTKIAPLLEKIAAVDSPKAILFLAKEFDRSSIPEVSAACAEAILSSDDDRAPQLVLDKLDRRKPLVQKAVFEGFAKNKKLARTAGDDLARAASGKLSDEAKSPAIRALARVETVPSARARLELLAAGSSKGRGRGRGARGAKTPASLRQVVVESFSKTKAAAVVAWLEADAFKIAGKDPERLRALLTVVGQLDLKQARPEVRDRVAHKDDGIAAAAVAALARLGIGDAVAAIDKRLAKARGEAGLRFRIEALDALAASGEATALEVVLRHAGGRDPDLRAIALGSLRSAAKGQPAARSALIRGLDDKDPSVRANALRSLAGLQDKSVIAPLIAQLSESEPYAFRVKSLELLVKLTGQNMGLVQADWEKWWDLAQRKFEFPKEGEAEFTSVEAYGLDYFGIEIASNRLTFIVDISSSMRQEVKVKRRLEEEERESDEPGGRTRVKKRKSDEGLKLKDGKAPKIEILKVELARVIRKLTADTQLNIVRFHASVEPWQKELQPLAGRGRKKVLDFVKTIQCKSGTNVFDSLEVALKDRRVDTIFLMTDGQPTRGRITDPAAIREEIRKLNRLRAVTIHTIAFGEASAFLEELAKENGGKYRFVEEY